jgi:archaellum component FlaC
MSPDRKIIDTMWGTAERKGQIEGKIEDLLGNMREYQHYIKQITEEVEQLSNEYKDLTGDHYRRKA